MVEAYETVLPQSSRMRLRAVLADPKRRPHLITFTSSSTARNFVQLLGKNAWRGRALSDSRRGPRPRFASIGPVTSATLRELGLPVDLEAEKYTIPGLIHAIVETRLAASPASPTP